MESNLDKIALDLYGKIQTRFPDIKIGDENATVLSKKQDIPNARFFEFEYTEGGEPLGTIAITLDADDGIVLQVSGDLVNDNSNTSHHSAYKFIRSFRQFAKDRLLNFDVQNIGKSNLDKRDYQFQAKRKEEPVMAQPPIMENKMYGSNKMSYQDLGEARIVVKHNQAVDANIPAGRTMHIESIYIENAQGERFRYPFKHLNGARALAEHIKAGGTPYDGIGKHITGLSEELASLRKFKGYVGRNEGLSEAMGDITSKVMERIDQVKKEIHSLQRPSYYQAFAEAFEERKSEAIPEAIMNDWIDRLTIRTFNEELKSVFPYIYNIVGEEAAPVKELGPEDIIGEGGVTLPNPDGSYPQGAFTGQDQVNLNKQMSQAASAATRDLSNFNNEYLIKAVNAMRNGIRLRLMVTGPEAEAELKKRGVEVPTQERLTNPEDQFESFMDQLIAEDSEMGDNMLFSPNKDAQQTAIEKLNQIMGKELKGGPEGINAIQSLTGLIDDPDFLDSLKDIDPDLDVRPVIQQYVTQNAPEIVAQLHFGGEEGGSAEPEMAPPAPASAPEAPPAAPEAASAAAAPAPAPAAPAPAAPVAEGQEDDNDPPFDPDKKPSKKTTAGKHGQGYSQARHLARQGLSQAIAKAKKAGAGLDTELDFGHKKMTLHDAIRECGMTPMECGFDDEPQETGVAQILKSIAGFWNKENRNFTIGGTRAKTKVVKGFKDGEYPNASPEDVKHVLGMIEKMDPSSNEHNQIMRLSGLPHRSVEMGEGPEQDHMATLQDLLAKMEELKKRQGANVTQTSTGTINGQPASYDDAMNKFKQMKIKFGDDELDFSNPDQIGGKMQGIMGNMMKGIQDKVPNQNIQAPGVQMNPADMMKGIMSKINFGK